MDNLNCSTEHRKGQHLTSEERHEIEVRRKDGWSAYRIAKHLGRAPNTIRNELRRGDRVLQNGIAHRYSADRGKEVYLENRKRSRRNYRCLETVAFLRYVVQKVKSNDKWSLDACVGYARETGKFDRRNMVCTKTLYNYVDLGFLPITNMDLPEKLRRNTKQKRIRANKKKLGRSIAERPEYISLREEFGHWEIDSVRCAKSADEPAVLTIVERKVRESIWLKVRNHSAEAVDEALEALFLEFGDRYREVFKSITADNGSEFANLSKLEARGIQVYFTHPYTSCEKGTNECHNRMLRRFLPKGKRVSDYGADDILFFADVINNLPRKILNYRTPEQLFETELDRIYAI